MYNLDFGDNQDTKRFIQDALKTKYTELSIVECFVYAILHFLEEYVIFPILGDHETLEMGPSTDLITDSEL